MEKINVFIDKEEINRLYDEEKYRNCMDKKYFEYIVSTGKEDYIDQYLNISKHKKLIEKAVEDNKVVKVIDKLLIVEKEKNKKRYIGELENSGICDIEVSEDVINKYSDKILLDGVFALITLEENMDFEYPYYVEEIEVLEDVNVNLKDYKEYFSYRVEEYREKKSREERVEDNEEEASSIKEGEENKYISEIELVLNTIGISTKELTFWEKILFLVRLIPLCESNYNLMELGGNGLGKTKTYSMFSPECEIVQEMLVTELIYHIKDKIPGLLKEKDVIVFDEINKIKLDGDKEKIVPQLLNYMSDGQTTAPRKLISKASLVFSGNVMGIQERIEKNEKNVFDNNNNNNHKLEDNAFLDRIHFFLPAWGLRRYSRNIHGTGILKYVFRFDYFAKALSLLREEDYGGILDQKGYIIRGGSEREERAIRKTVSGLIKLTYPEKKIDDKILEAYIAIAIKGRSLINKFLSNKNKNNVSEIDVKVTKISSENKYKEIEVEVNESLKEMMHLDYGGEISGYIDEIIEDYNKNNGNNYSIDNYFRNFYNGKEISYEGRRYREYDGLFYPNRTIIPISDRNGRHVFIIKVALDKIGIEKNKREYRTLMQHNIENVKFKGVDGRVLVIEAKDKLITTVDINKNKKVGDEVEIGVLCDLLELNYDGLFGGTSLDKNDFSSIRIGFNEVELDFSNYFNINIEKKIKCEALKQEIIPIYLYNTVTGNYRYRDKNDYISDPMNYVEFKYFLKERGVIKI